MGRKRTPKEYKSMLDLVRHYAAGFDVASGYDARRISQWSSGKKSTLSRYFNEIHRLTYRPHTIFHPIKKKNLVPVQNFSQHQPGYPKIKVAFVPGVVKPKITVKPSGQVIARDKIHGITKRTIMFDKYALITDTDNEIQRALDADRNSRAFRIMAGSFEIGNVYSRGVIPEVMIKLMSRYNQPDTNNFYGNWLHGIIGYEFDEREKFMDFNRELIKAKEKIKDERRKLQRKVQYETQRRAQYEKLKKIYK